MSDESVDAVVDAIMSAAGRFGNGKIFVVNICGECGRCNKSQDSLFTRKYAHRPIFCFPILFSGWTCGYRESLWIQGGIQEKMSIYLTKGARAHICRRKIDEEQIYLR